MKPNQNRILAPALSLLVLMISFAQVSGESLFDGKTFSGWEGKTNSIWKIQDGAIVGGSLVEKVVQNEFLCSERQFTNFVLKLKFKLLGTNGFVNSGVQIRSQRVPNHHEVSGYQADLGQGWWGALYDESRRDKVLAKPDEKEIAKHIKLNEWNDYTITCRSNRIQLKINDFQTVDYVEPDLNIPQHGRLGLQIHGGGVAQAWFKDIQIQTLP